MISFLLVLTIALTGTASRADGESIVSVRSVVEIDEAKTEITLGDLIAGPTVSRTATEKLHHVRLADAPKPGESRSFTDSGLNDVFKPELAIIEKQTGEKFQLRIPSHVTVTKKRFHLDQAQVEKTLIENLKSICADCEFEVRGLNVPAIGSTLGADTQWKIMLRSEIPHGSFSLPIEVTETSGAKRSYWISGTLTVMRPVAVSTRSIAAGERLQPEDIVMQKKDVTFSQDTAVSEIDLATSIAAKPIGVGQIVWKSSLRRELAVKFGDPIKVTAGNDSWQITVDGVAQNAGYLGDVVRVKIPRTQKIVSGLLHAKGVVEVQ